MKSPQPAVIKTAAEAFVREVSRRAQDTPPRLPTIQLESMTIDSLAEAYSAKNKTSLNNAYDEQSTTQALAGDVTAGGSPTPVADQVPCSRRCPTGAPPRASCSSPSSPTNHRDTSGTRHATSRRLRYRSISTAFRLVRRRAAVSAWQ
ncbi:hypothetical protein LX15_001133 [Streptoalloteichus tenebrarius]|uniref:Uncharacterized protein n=1 Tax=Streptoalloteichus tenebrarius (strain ATCC 17920 / DSM 40477 / JCM 4838 / CBS 697.72 / NBRC 16177 / NCIMB 11028 / NRRL B-12390 / A12253. 1 / ISP 5477) TaxID=1933 RepID=A0ABT1HPK1_STRSD|nr:hypothetical protein [Streptoalloteichus tenebrarius]MCP2257448.1 hypothetical protein [Streptoalloteichus tenebrarius]